MPAIQLFMVNGCRPGQAFVVVNGSEHREREHFWVKACSGTCRRAEREREREACINSWRTARFSPRVIREEEAKESLTPSTGRLLFPSFPSFCHLDLGARGGGRGGGSVEDAEAAREHSSSRAVITRREVGETVSTTPIPTLSYLTAPRFLVTFASFSSPRLRFLSARL
ncbi:hypothetical protein BHM03_00040228 [Ensete ventricosum]|nr:hypothetical protein BHM03_00040228 [Ensete ventricosum]